MNNFAKKNKIAIILILIILMLGAFPIVKLLTHLSFSNSKVCWNWGLDQKSTFPKDKLTQSFFPEKDGLRAIVIKPLLENDIFDTTEATFIFKNELGETVFSKKVRHFAMENNKMYELSLPPDIFLKEKQYLLEISPSIEAQPGQGLGFWITNGDCYQGGLKVDRKNKKGTDLAITFKYSNNNFLADLKMLFERMAQYKPLSLKNSLLLPTLFASFILGSLLLASLLAKSMKDD